MFPSCVTIYWRYMCEYTVNRILLELYWPFYTHVFTPCTKRSVQSTHQIWHTNLSTCTFTSKFYKVIYHSTGMERAKWEEEKAAKSSCIHMCIQCIACCTTLNHTIRIHCILLICTITIIILPNNANILPVSSHDAVFYIYTFSIAVPNGHLAIKGFRTNIVVMLNCVSIRMWKWIWLARWLYVCVRKGARSSSIYILCPLLCN